METRTCSCGESETRTVAATGHTFGDWTVTTAPTCTEKGVETRTCACSESETREVDALGHEWEGIHCTRCDAIRNPFTDVDEVIHKSFYDAILWAVDEGITTGATETTFNPGGELQRAQFVTFLWRAAGKPEPTSTKNPFTDVNENDFFYKAVLWAVEEEITTGTDTDKFSPFGVTNRAQAVTFLWRYLEKPAANGTNDFNDVEAGLWYEAPINWAVGAGVTNGMGDGTFGINNPCNRAQAVTFMFRAIAT